MTLNAIDAGITDLAGNALQNTSTRFWTVDRTGPIPTFIDIPLTPRNAPLGVVTILFDEAVTGVDLTDLSLTFFGTPVSLAGLTLTNVNASTYTIDLSSVTAISGLYEIKLRGVGSNIQDVLDNSLAADLVMAFNIDRELPVALIATVDSPAKHGCRRRPCSRQRKGYRAGPRRFHADTQWSKCVPGQRSIPAVHAIVLRT